MHVDEAGGDDQARGVNDLGPGDVHPAADRFDPAAVKEKVADGIGPGAGIDQPPVSDQDFQDVSVSG
jgi:hypothetical protein